MDWSYNRHSKSRPTLFPLRLWFLAFLTVTFGYLEILSVAADSSPPVADVEDLFKGKLA